MGKARERHGESLQEICQMTSQVEICAPETIRGWNIGRDFPAILVIACIAFNFGLCFINANVTPISAGPIILCEIILIGLSAAYGFRRLTKAKIFWLGVLALQIFWLGLLSMAKQELLMKPLRDVMILPIFVTLGLAAYRLEFTKILLWISAAITALAMFEVLAAQTFLMIFNFKSYFVAKGAMEDLNWLALNTFASGIRPGGRFLFDLPGVHRISSVFLEPVSLGFYAFISALYFVCVKNTMTRLQYGLGLFISFLLIWLSDGRMALGCLIIMLSFRSIFSRLDHRFSLLIFPLCLFLAYVVDQAQILNITGEGLGARIHSTMMVLSQSNFDILLGLSKYAFTADSGLADLLQNQGILGVVLYWISPALFIRKLPQQARIYLFGLSIYLSFGFLLSPAVFSIKTAALLWFLYGYLISRDFTHEAIEPNSR